jgi:hypothetical protein
LTLLDAQRKFTLPHLYRSGTRSMQVDEQMTITDGVCTFRPFGKTSLVEGVERVTRVIAECRTRNVTKLLVDLTELFGYPIPTLADRFWMAQDWAQAAQGKLVIAFVALPEYIDPKKFGVKAAADAGLKGEVFTTVADAQAWLQANAPD